jgi:glycosyltransferase involved in cell wall biosynthesis
LKILHIPFHFQPGRLGGTEIYVASLCRALSALGLESAIAAPAHTNYETNFEGTQVYYFGLARQVGFEQAHGKPDTVAANNFRAVLHRWRPDVVHLHARSSAVSELLADEAKSAGCKVVYTYHTPTASCPRGTMMRGGGVPCDGKLNTTRCTECVLQLHGVPWMARTILARTPIGLGKLIANFDLNGGLWTALRMRALITEGKIRYLEFIDKLDRVVAVCDWVAQVLSKNGLSGPKLFVSRQGLPYGSIIPGIESRVESKHGARLTDLAPLKIRFFGRLDATKGADVLVNALHAIPKCNVQLEIYGIQQDVASVYSMGLDALISRDRRITLKAALAPDRVVCAMRDCDLVVVPSRLLETGPLVVLESFAAGTPVMGSRLGGIAELVRDGVDGVLIEEGNVGAWAQAIADIEKDRACLQALRSEIRSPRTALDVANEMKRLYRALT